jgi:hypothetical protein
VTDRSQGLPSPSREHLLGPEGVIGGENGSSLPRLRRKSCASAGRPSLMSALAGLPSRTSPEERAKAGVNRASVEAGTTEWFVPRGTVRRFVAG